MPAKATISVWRGNTFDVKFALSAGTPPAALDLTGSTLVFIAKWDGGQIRKETGVDAAFVISNAAAGEATLQLTPAETRSIPLGDQTRFEVERRIGGTQKTFLYGNLIAAGWVNDD